MHVEKNGSDEISGGNQIGSDTFQNGSDIIRYPTVILSPVFTPAVRHYLIKNVITLKLTYYRIRRGYKINNDFFEIFVLFFQQ